VVGPQALISCSHSIYFMYISDGPLEGDERPNVEAVHCQLRWILNRIYGVAALKSGSDSKN